ncbi:MAG: amidohydrolase [Betaproteobacteria bacterium]|nr:amidohydrolase [Betaproteobacteria bacterium]
MFIADAQVHVWAPNTPERPWRAGPVKPHREVALTPESLLREMDAAGVHRAVLVPPSWDADRNDLVLEAARRHPDRFAVMGRLNADAPGARDSIATWRRQPGMLGLRCSFNRAQWAPALTEGRVDWLWEEAEKAGVPIMLMVTHAMMPIIDSIAGRYPRLKLSICHLALDSSKRDEEAFRDLDRLLAIAGRPNVTVKASAMPAYTSDGYPYRRLHPYLRRVYDAFGPKRMFWGTDFSRLKCSYRQAVTMFTEEIPWFTAKDKEWIMGRGLCEWLGWKPPQA